MTRVVRVITTKRDLDDFVGLLKKHDWFWEYSEDPRVWREGRESWNNIMAAASKDPVANMLTIAYSNRVRFKDKDNDYEKALRMVQEHVAAYERMLVRLQKMIIPSART